MSAWQPFKWLISVSVVQSSIWGDYCLGLWLIDDVCNTIIWALCGSKLCARGGKFTHHSVLHTDGLACTYSTQTILLKYWPWIAARFHSASCCIAKCTNLNLNLKGMITLWLTCSLHVQPVTRGREQALYSFISSQAKEVVNQQCVVYHMKCMAALWFYVNTVDWAMHTANKDLNKTYTV